MKAFGWLPLLVGLQIVTFGLVTSLWMIEFGHPEESAANVVSLTTVGAILILLPPILGIAVSEIRDKTGW